MNDDVGAVFEGPDEVRRRHGVVDDERDVVTLSDGADGLEVNDHPARIGNRLHEDGLGALGDGGLEGRGIVAIGPHHVPTEILERVGELVDGAAVEPPRRHELVARLQERVHDDDLRRVAGGDGEGGGAALQGRDALFQDGAGRVADARIDVPERLQAEQGCGVVDVVEHEGGGLIDGGRAGARCGVRGRARMDGERVEAGQTVRHGVLLETRRRRGEWRRFHLTFGRARSTADGACKNLSRERERSSRRSRPG
jgi:hypothetical protein